MIVAFMALNLTHVINESTLTVIGALAESDEKALCAYTLKRKNFTEFIDIKSCTGNNTIDKTTTPCTLPLCSNIVIPEYDSTKEHLISVTAVGISEATLLPIPIPSKTDEPGNHLTITFKLDGNSII